MISDLKPYSKYQDTGLPWVGQMPAHWKQRRMKFLFSERVQKGFPDEPLLAATQNKGVVTKEMYGERTVTASKDFHLLKLVEVGDFVISLRSFQGGIEVSHCRGIISPAYTILTPQPEALQSYYSRFLKSRDFISSLTFFVTGIREGQNIDYERLSRAYMPLPPEDEQELIGRFLCHTNERLEKAIRTKRKMITLLHEQKQVIIHRAVTRGLDPSVAIKSTGLPWISEMPAHWKQRRMKFLFSERVQKGFPDEPLLAATQNKGVVTKEMYGERTVTASKDFHLLKLVEVGDFVISLRSFQGGIEIAHCRGIISPAYTILTPQREVRRDYYSYFFKSPDFISSLKLFVTGIREGQNIDYERLSRAYMPLPPEDEQKQIAAWLDTELVQINVGLSRLEREVKLLREYRTRLIADVVTGKIDVREAAKNLPPETEIIEDSADEAIEEGEAA